MGFADKAGGFALRVLSCLGGQLRPASHSDLHQFRSTELAPVPFPPFSLGPGSPRTAAHHLKAVHQFQTDNLRNRPGGDTGGGTVGLSPATEEALPGVQSTAGSSGDWTCALPTIGSEGVFPASPPTPHLIALTA